MPDLIGHLLSFRAKSRNLLFSAAAREKRERVRKTRACVKSERGAKGNGGAWEGDKPAFGPFGKGRKRPHPSLTPPEPHPSALAFHTKEANPESAEPTGLFASVSFNETPPR